MHPMVVPSLSLPYPLRSHKRNLMPHLILEYSANLQSFDTREVLALLNQAMLDTALFSESDIKSRAIKLDDFQVGMATENRAFIHVRVAMLAGRIDAERRKTTEALLAVLTAAMDKNLTGEIQLSVETVEIDVPSYAKAIIHGH